MVDALPNMYKLLVSVVTMLRGCPLVHQLAQSRSIKYSLGVLHVPSTSFSPELQYTLQSESRFARIRKHSNLVKRHCRWLSRHDQSKRLFFNYLLLDSRITDGLRNRAKCMHKVDVWLTFLRSIFYVGKGKATRPYVHLYQAHKLLRSGNPVVLAKDPKLALIVHLWQQNRGVVLLRSFSGISSSDAHTREAAMIDALGINHLTNRRVGVYFGVARSKFTKEQRRLMGVLLLYRLLMVYLKNEECELRPEIASLKNICHQ
ncbi:PREDICTED: ankyrin repeat and LEM domain-containing protein 1 [Drosophila arizonae]|uniref:Ankyrin repeat and LEM domain-containing protein 1 n=1 Tax=Drosophila arizonae TaxID=7263 RepID=A0ABM1PFY5_DROAR|nr:PREDICTED: ankyrin repeat and LEM domain-containing protein 1 [Drosophila arizonae]